MPDHGGKHGPGWGPDHSGSGEWGPGGRYWGRHQAGDEWRGFGRKAFFGFLLFVAFVVAVLAGIGYSVWWAISSAVGLGWSALVWIPLGFLALIVLAARSGIRTWRPVRRMIDAAGSLADGDYGVRVRPTGSRGMRSVMWSFNEMAERLETSDEQRRQLLADVGHEIRTPLTVIRGEIEAMLDGVHEPDPEHLRILLDEVAVMERLLDDLRTLSLAEAGVLTLHPEPIDLDDLISDVAQAYRSRAADAGVVVRLDLDRTIDDVVLDPVRIRGVVSNLVGNAMHAMPDGGALSITARQTPDAISIRVEDTGNGIPAEELANVFDRFRKGSSSQGSGLGLTITRNLVEAHGGEIVIDSEIGLGTTVTVTLPRLVEFG